MPLPHDFTCRQWFQDWWGHTIYELLHQHGFVEPVVMALPVQRITWRNRKSQT
jgi:hypothetical protein